MIEKEYKKKIRELQEELDELKNKQLSSKDQIIRQFAKMFNENPIEIEKYKLNDGTEKTYEKLNHFYECLSRMGKDQILELMKKIKELSGNK